MYLTKLKIIEVLWNRPRGERKTRGRVSLNNDNDDIDNNNTYFYRADD